MPYELLDLANTNTGDFIRAFSGIPPEVTELDLRFNNFGGRSTPDLTRAFSKIPIAVHKLNLYANDLGQKRGTELVDIFILLPGGLQILDLSVNKLGERSVAELVQAFKNLPKRLTDLDLGMNDLGKKTPAELAQIFASLPSSLKKLRLDHIDSYIDSPAERHAFLVEVFKAIPANVEFIGLDRSTNQTNEERNALLMTLPVHVKYFSDGSGYEVLEEFREMQRPIALAGFTSLLDIINTKKTKLKDRGFDQASIAANTLCDNLTRLKGEYLGKKLSLSDFKTEAHDEVVKARLELGNHRGWKEVLVNLGLCILGLGIGYLAVCAYRGGFFKVNTDSANTLDQLQKAVDAQNVPTI